MKKRKTPFYETFTLNGKPIEPDYEKEGPQDMVMRVLKHAPHPLRLDDILRIGGISRRFKRDVLMALQALADADKLVRLNGGAWVSADSLKTVRGVIAMQRSGAAFLVPAAGEKPFAKGDVFIDPDSVGQAWNGDTVEVVLLPGRHGPSPEGRVLRVLERGQSELTVRVVRPERKGNAEPGEARRVLCRPADPRLNFDMLVDVTELLAQGRELQRDELLRVAVGQLLPSPEDNPLWSGTALRSLGLEDDVTVQEQLVKLNHMIPTSFPDDVLTEAQAVAAGESEALAGAIEDVRSIPLVTIDGADARDFDDAIFVEARQKGWRLLVAIADVSYYVRPRSRLDKEALARGNSYYFPTSVEPMLPEALSNGVCSLRPDEERRVMVADMELDASGIVRESRFYNAVMQSHARLTYEQAQQIMDGSGEFPPAIVSMLAEAGKLAEVLIQRRSKRGGLDFDIPEAEFTTTDGRVTGVRHRQRLFSHRLIEAFMVCANEAVAEFFSKKDAPLLFRVHPEPGPEKLETLVRSLRAVSLPLPLPALSAVTKAPSYTKGHDRPRRKPDSNVSPSGAQNPAKSISQWLPAVLAAAADTPQSYIVGRLALRSMMQARYTPEKEIHFGLASEAYSHFTSPIRRYADLVTHRALKHALGLDIGGAIPTGHKLFEVAELCNTHEKTAQDAEREIARRLGCLLLQDRVGEDFRGIISGVTNFGLFVELEGLPLEGMIKVETLGNDYYEYNPDRQELRGKSTGEAWRLGQALDVRLVEVNVGRLEVTLALADDPDNPRTERPAFRRSARPQGARYATPKHDSAHEEGRRDGGKRKEGTRKSGQSRGSRSR